jgi:hypothetical protein
VAAQVVASRAVLSPTELVIQTRFNCNKVLGCPGFQFKKDIVRPAQVPNNAAENLFSQNFPI